MSTRYSTSYIFSYNPSDENDVKKLKELKQRIKNQNKTADVKQRVVLAGRLGKNNPSAVKYRKGGEYSSKQKPSWFPSWYGGHPYQTIRVADAAYFDVYVYNK
jgi:hypothetical protein